MIVLGTRLGSRDVVTRLVEAGVNVRLVGEPEAVRDRVDEQTRCLIVVPPVPDLSVEGFCRTFLRDHPRLPTLVVVRGTIDARDAQRLRDGGVEAVFSWPADRDPLATTALRLAGGLHAARVSKGGGADVAVEELVKTRLDAHDVRFGPSLVVRVRHRYVILGGRVDRLWKLHVAEALARDVVGVEDVVAAGVEVEGESSSDLEVARAICHLLRHASGVDPSTMALRVDDGRVTLTGTAAQRPELERALELIRQVRGVRRIDNYCIVSQKDKRRDRGVVKRVVQSLRSQHPRAKVEANVFGGVAVLTGRVARPAERRALEQLVARQPGVQRVIDRLKVSATPTS